MQILMQNTESEEADSREAEMLFWAAFINKN